MRKLFLFATAAICALSLNAASYGIMINGTDFHAGTENPSPSDASFKEYMALGVSVVKDATLQLWDDEAKAGWAVDLDVASVAGIVRDGDHYTCTADGCYDFYIKLKMNADQLYIGSCSSGEGGEGGEGEGGEQQTASYGIMINGTDFHAGTENPSPSDASFKEYMVLGVDVAKDATLQLYDNGAKAGWAVDLDGASVAGIVRDGDHYTCTADGCYDFYIKLKMNADQLYIGSCSGGSGEQGGGEQGEGGLSNKDFYLKGYRGPTEGDIQTPTIEEKFEEGILEYEFEGEKGKGYFFVLVCEPGQVIGECYMAAAYSEETHCTLAKQDASHEQKLGVPAPKVKFYLYDNEDGTLELSTVEIPGKRLAGTKKSGGEGGEGEEGDEAIDNVTYELNVNAPMYDLLGRQVTEDYRGVVIQNGHKFIR